MTSLPPRLLKDPVEGGLSSQEGSVYVSALEGGRGRAVGKILGMRQISASAHRCHHPGEPGV